MPLHVTSSTVGREAPLSQVPTEVDTDQASSAPEGGRPDAVREHHATTDTASISNQGQRLAALGDQGAQLQAIAEAEQLAKSLAAKMAQNASAATAAHGAIDPSRVAQLLDG
jgi:hypothetical protein